MNIMFYLYMKASSVPVKTHPVIQRLVEIKKVSHESHDPTEISCGYHMITILAADWSVGTTIQ